MKPINATTGIVVEPSGPTSLFPLVMNLASESNAQLKAPFDVAFKLQQTDPSFFFHETVPTALAGVSTLVSRTPQTGPTGVSTERLTDTLPLPINTLSPF